MGSFVVSAFVAFGFVIVTQAAPIARVNQAEIRESDLALFLARNPELPKDEAIDRMILFRLAVQEAKNKELDKTPEAKEQFDKVLYTLYLENELANAKKSFDVPVDELAQVYAATPMVRLRHLALPDSAASDKKLSSILAELKKGKDFKTLVRRSSPTKSPEQFKQRDLPFEGKYDLPEPLYEQAIALKIGEVGAPIRVQGQIHLLQRLETLSFEMAPSSYVQNLRQKARAERERQFLLSVLDKLKKEADVEKF